MYKSNSNNALNLDLIEEIPLITSWEEVESLPNFKEKIDPKRVEIVDLVAPYDLRPFKKCSLSGCGTKHGDGFVAEGSDGSLFKLGGTCGQNFFPEKYQLLKNSLTQRFNEQVVRNEIIVAHADAALRMDKLHRVLMREFDSTPLRDWYRRFNKLISTGFEVEIMERIRIRAHQGRPIISISREVSDERMDRREKEIYEVSGLDKEYVSEDVHIISGLNAVKNYKKLHPGKLQKMLVECDEFQSIDPRFLNQDRLKYWLRWCASFDMKLSQLLEVATDCSRFYSNDNVIALRRYKRYL